MYFEKLNVVSATAGDLRDLLQAKQASSVQLVKAYLRQIAKHDAALKAFICLAPEENVVATAASLDKERLEGHVRSPLHGVPVVLKVRSSCEPQSEILLILTIGKDCFVSAAELGMSTTAGSCALVGAKANKNSAMVQKMIDAGLIILGKTNMTEFAGMKMTMMMPGWSAYGGQTISPYVGKIEEGDTILGHSAPGDFFDSPGPMAKCAADVQALLEVMLRKEFLSSGPGEWKDVSIGFADPQMWKMAGAMCRQHQGTAEEMVLKYVSCMELLRSTACELQYPISIPDISVLTVDEEDAIMPIASYTEQGDIVKAFENEDTEENVARLRDGLRSKARSVLEPVFLENKIDIIAAPSDSPLCIHAAAAGCPIATVPLGQLTYNQRPFGLCLMAREGYEESLLRFMHLYESVAPARPVPQGMDKA
ncbi:hypothetical protein Daus18300_014241 [Diaporthe australafricana]|uniref:Amidase domain-containing protein n=1 Tax=Diaporthe australafricana TaxID=127596 RepID=A0ABR3VVZ7_9PEZI